MIKYLSEGTSRLLISRDGIGWKVKLIMSLNGHVIWIQSNKVNMNEMDCGTWNESDGMWIEGNKNETWSMKCGLTEMRWNMNNEIDNATSPFEFSDLTSGSEIMSHTLSHFFCFFVCLKKNSICSFSRYLTNYATFLQIPLWFLNNT